MSPLELPPSLYFGIMTLAIGLLGVPVLLRSRGFAVAASPSVAAGSALMLAAVILPLGFGTACVSSAPIRHYHMGHLGGPLAITKVDGIVDRYLRYSAYGEVRRYDKDGLPIALDPESRKEYTGYDSIGTTGIQYAGLRFYDPTVAQFLTMDPVEQFSNPYSYTGWDPINRTDPSGALAGLELAALVVMIVGALVALAQAIRSFAAASNVSSALTSIVLSFSGVGIIMGIVQQPATIGFYVPIVGGIAAGIYGLTLGGSSTDLVFAGVGLALSVAGAAFAVSRAGASEDQPERRSEGDSSSQSGGDANRAAIGDQIESIFDTREVYAQHDALEDTRPFSQQMFEGFEACGLKCDGLGLVVGGAALKGGASMVRAAFAVDSATVAAGGVASQGIIATNGFRFFFGRAGVLNSNQYLRIGLSRDGGDLVFRAGGRLVQRFTDSGHFIFRNFGKL